jgi:signal transduction histidine kinase
MAVAFTLDGIPHTLPQAVTVCLFRVAQEAVRNAVKYSQGKHLTLDLRQARGGLALTIVDDGVGFDLVRAWGNGLGLISISERVESTGGRVEIRTGHGHGTRFDVWVPLNVEP